MYILIKQIQLLNVNMKYITNYTCIYNIYCPNMNFMPRVTQWHGTMIDLESVLFWMFFIFSLDPLICRFNND